MIQSLLCPRCDEYTDILFEIIEDTEQTLECENCGATLYVHYEVQIEIKDVKVEFTPTYEFDCPSCDKSLELVVIETESGYKEMICPRCKTDILVTWDDWGREVEAEPIGEEETEEEEAKDRSYFPRIDSHGSPTPGRLSGTSSTDAPPPKKRLKEKE